MGVGVEVWVEDGVMVGVDVKVATGKVGEARGVVAVGASTIGVGGTVDASMVVGNTAIVASSGAGSGVSVKSSVKVAIGKVGKERGVVAVDTSTIWVGGAVDASITVGGIATVGSSGGTG